MASRFRIGWMAFVAVPLLAISSAPAADAEKPAAEKPNPAKPAAEKPAAGERRFVNFGVALTPPPGWTEIIQDQGKTVVQWVLNDAGGKGPVARIMVEGGKPSAETPELAASQLAKDWGGIVDADATDLAGVKAFRVLAPRPPSGIRPVEGIVAFHDGHLYTILGGVSPDAKCHDAIEAVRKSWRWIPFANPAENVEFRPRPVTLDAITLDVPALMHSHPLGEVKGKLMLQLGLFDLSKGGMPFLVNVAVSPTPTPDSFDDACKRLADGMREKLDLVDPVVWREGKGQPRRVISQLCPVKAKEGRKPWAFIWALVELHDKRIALLTFTIDPSVQGYPAVAERMANSVREVPRAE